MSVCCGKGSSLLCFLHSIQTMTDKHSIYAAFQRFLKLERNYTPNTVEAYMHDLDWLRRYMESKKLAPQDVRMEHLQEFAVSLHEHGIGVSSQARILSGIRAFFRFLQMEKIIEDNPAARIDSPQLGQHLPEVLTPGEVDALQAAIDLTSANGHRDKAMIEILFACGLRISELLQLKLSDLYLKDGYIRVWGKGRKERLVPIGQSSISVLEQWFACRVHWKIKPGNEDYVFLSSWGTPLSRMRFHVVLKELAATAGIRKNISAHTLRHSFATALLRGGADLRSIQDMLGHEHIVTTEIYTHLSTEDLRRAIVEHHPRNVRHKAARSAAAASSESTASEENEP